jgi:hypothetical protein
MIKLEKTSNRSSHRALTAVASLALLASTACHGGNVQVNTLAAPNAQFSGRSTFRILPMPTARGVTLSPQDPMLQNSITYQAMREELRQALEGRGYTPATGGAADLDVAYYATAQPKLDVQTWNYGYTWRGFPRRAVDVTQYEQGTVLVDVIDPHTHELLWRGQGVAPVSTNPTKYSDELRHAVDAIVKKFPSH